MITALTIALVGSVMVFAAPYHNKAALLAGYYMVSVYFLFLWVSAADQGRPISPDFCFPYRLHSAFIHDLRQHRRAHEESCNQLTGYDWL